MSKKQTNILIIIMLFVMLGAGFVIGWFFSKPLPETQTVTVPSDPYDEIMTRLSNIDENSDADILKEFEKINNLFGVNYFHRFNKNDLGITFEYKNGNIVVKSVENPNLREYLFPGDEISEIDDLLLATLTNKQIEDLIHSKNKHQLSGLSYGENFEIDVEYYDEITKSLSFENITPQTIHVKFNNLIKGVYEEFYQVLNHINNNNFDKIGNRLIIDLRGVSDGAFTSITQIAQKLMPMEAGSLTMLKSLDGKTILNVAGGLIKPLNYEVKVLVDENTSNFGTILAYALGKRHQVIGNPSYNYVIFETINFKNHPLQYSFEAFMWDSTNVITSNITMKNLFLYINDFKFEDTTINSVSNSIRCIQMLYFLTDYSEIRIDGYFDSQTQSLIENFQNANSLELLGYTLETYKAYLSWYYDVLDNLEYDLMIKEALK